jgi:uncharacterized phage protein (TIGR02216 family)
VSACFGEAAAQLCGLASSLLGWRPDEFWSATPAELATALLPRGAVAEPLRAEQIAELRQRFPDD